MLSIFSNFIFDLDGTLVDSSEEILSSLKEAYGIVLPDLEIKIDRSVIGPPAPQMIKNITPFLGQDQVDKINLEFRRIYDSGDFSKTKLFDGILEFLHLLLNKNRNLFIVTNKPMVPTQRMLAILKMDFFNAVVTPDSISGKDLTKSQMLRDLISKNNINKKEAVFIGDTYSDINAAKTNGIISVGVLWGYGDKKQLEDSNPKFLVANINELSKLAIEDCCKMSP